MPFEHTLGQVPSPDVVCWLRKNQLNDFCLVWYVCAQVLVWFGGFFCVCYWRMVLFPFLVCLLVCLFVEQKRDTETDRGRERDNMKLDMSRGLEDLGVTGRGEEYDQIISQENVF